MKPKYEWSRSTKTKLFPTKSKKPPQYYEVDTTLTQIYCTPSTGKNPGNRKDPTAWEYGVNISQKYTGCVVEHWPAGVEDNRVIGTYGEEAKILAPWDRTNLYNRALERLNSKVRDRANWAEDVAQANKVAKLGRLARNAEELARKLRRNPIAGISDGYLQFRYGWKPLMQNVYDTAKALLNRPSRTGVILQAGATLPIDSSALIANSASGSSLKAVKHVETGKQGCRLVVRLTGLPENDISSFTTLSPVELAWNLIPYSFVVDWFYNVGGYLAAQEAALRNNAIFAGGYVTELYATSVTESIEETPNSAKGLFLVKYGRARRKQISFKRTPLRSWPLPRRPVVNTDLGSSHLLAAAALLGAILGR